MTAVALVRAPFRPLEVQESWDAQLLEQAAKLVGYRPSAVAEIEATRKRSLDESIFARGLERAGIQPFTVQSVENYKALMLKRARKGESWRLTQYMHHSGYNHMEEGETVVFALGLPTWIAFGITSIVSAVVGFGDGHWAYVPYVSGLPTLSVGIWSWLMYLRHKRAVEVQADWNTYNVDKGYSKPIPSFAVARMVSLKQELPEVTFSVQELGVTKQEIKTEKRIPPPPPDPFLVANFRGVCAYVDVWDEPKFEGRRTV